MSAHAHRASGDDLAYRRAFEALQVAPAAFDHAAHVRLAYVYLCEGPPAAAAARMKEAILAFLRHLGADPAKYHETLTQAWILAVDHFMQQAAPSASYAEFVGRSPQLLERDVMLTHYSAEVLFSAEARAGFVRPDIQEIPPP